MKFRIGGLLVLGLLLLATGGGLLLIYQTLPGYPREVRQVGMKAPGRILYDAWGVPTLEAQSDLDLMRLQGYAVARDRFFQMDLIRRRASGRLAEILGEKLVPSDKQRRIYGFTHVAEKAWDLMVPPRQRVLLAFADGVNAFLREGPTPPEIRALGYTPDPWEPTDSMLVVLSMWDPPPTDDEINATQAHAANDPLLQFLSTEYGFLDAPILASDPKLPPIAVPAAPNSAAPATPAKEKSTRGSNAWAIAAARTQSHVPLLAGDPHLGLSIPNVWYRLRLEAEGMHITGVTIPGVPGVILGTNGQVAWAFTNPFADQVDRVVLDSKTPVTRRKENIWVKGAAEFSVVAEDSEWGPVVAENTALQWVGLDPVPLAQMDVLELDRATDLPSAMLALSHWTGPAQNAIVATKDGHIAWTVIGRFPQRVGFDGSVAAPRDKAHRWNGYYPFSAHPKVIDPPSGFIVSANQRTVPINKALHDFGRDWPSSNRAFRIQTLLSAKEDWTVEDMQKVQLDVLSPTHLWYREQLLANSAGGSEDESRWLSAIRAVVEPWDGKASADSAAYPILREFRLRLQAALIDPLVDELHVPLVESARTHWHRDTTVQTLLAHHPNGDKIRAAAVAAAKSLAESPDALAQLRWGTRNRAHIRHPFSFVLPEFLGPLINMPAHPQAGDVMTVRNAEPEHGASMRMLVDLSDPTHSRYAQPGGQSGHVLSPFYRNQHPLWAEGRYSALEPESAVHTIIFPD